MRAKEEINALVKAACFRQTKSAAFDLSGNLKYILKSIGENRLTRSELWKSMAIGAAASALGGAGIGALTGKRGNRWKRAKWGALIGALAGGAAGPAYAQIRKYLDGVPFDNSSFEKADHKKGDKVYIGVAGSANGQNDSWFRDDMYKQLGDKNVYMLRHVDKDNLVEKYDELKAKGLDVYVVGHSSGAATVGRFMKERPEARGLMIDPVSWTRRFIPKNALIFTSDKSTRHGGVFENTVADIGGRWNYSGPNSVTFKGSHSNRNNDIIRDFASKFISPGDSFERPSYVTGVSGS